LGRLAYGREAEIVVRALRPKIVAALVALGAAAAIVAIVLVTTQPGVPTPRLPANGLVTHANVIPTTAHFGDTIVAHVNVLYDPKRVLAPRFAVSRDLSDYNTAGAPVIATRSVGAARAIDYSVRLTCLDHSCLPADPAVGSGTNEFSLPSIELNYAKPHATGLETLSIPLPPVEVTSRLSTLEAAQLNAPPHPPLRASSSPLPVQYAVSPGLLEALFVAAAVALLALAGFLFARFGPTFRRTRPLPSPLERALLLVERTRTRGIVPEQRKALDLLADELGRFGEEDLALSARVLAWSEPAPEGDATGALAGAVRENVLVGRSNGRPR
jgi:hypothetical protein